MRIKSVSGFRQGLILTGLGVAVWAVATLFFRLFGHWVLASPGDPHFGSFLFLLELLTLLALIGAALIVRLKWFPEKGSATRFGYAGTAVGLLLDFVSIWRREAVFPDFSEGQHHAFAIWMTLGYALMLVVPAVVDRLIRAPAGKPDEDLDAVPKERMGVADADRTT